MWIVYSKRNEDGTGFKHAFNIGKKLTTIYHFNYNKDGMRLNSGSSISEFEEKITPEDYFESKFEEIEKTFTKQTFKKLKMKDLYRFELTDKDQNYGIIVEDKDKICRKIIQNKVLDNSLVRY